jgi:hypothetical protein
MEKRYMVEHRQWVRGIYAFYSAQFPTRLFWVSSQEFYQKLQELDEDRQSGRLAARVSAGTPAALPHRDRVPDAYKGDLRQVERIGYLLELDIQKSTEAIRKTLKGEQVWDYQRILTVGTIGYRLWNDLMLQEEAKAVQTALNQLDDGPESSQFLAELEENLSSFDTRTLLRLTSLMEMSFGIVEVLRREAVVYRRVAAGEIAGEYLPHMRTLLSERVYMNPFLRDVTISDSQGKRKPLLQAMEELEFSLGLMTKEEFKDCEEERKEVFSHLPALEETRLERLERLEGWIKIDNDHQIRKKHRVDPLLLILAVAAAVFGVVLLAHGQEFAKAATTWVIVALTAGVCIPVYVVTWEDAGSLIFDGIFTGIAAWLIYWECARRHDLSAWLYLFFFLLAAILAVVGVLRLSKMPKGPEARKGLSKEKDEYVSLEWDKCVILTCLLESYVDLLGWSDPWLQEQVRSFRERYQEIEKQLQKSKK